MFAKCLIFCLALITFYSVESNLLDSVEFVSSLDFQLDEELSRVRRDSNSLEPSEDDVWNTRWNIWANNFIEKISKRYYNISVIGWENVYDASGNIEQVNSLELVFPPREDAAEMKMLNKPFRDDLHDRSLQKKLFRHSELYKQLSLQGILLDIFIEGRDRHTGDSSTLVHWTPDSMYYRMGGLVTYNKTQDATELQIKNFFDEVSSRNESVFLKPSILMYDEHGNLYGHSENLLDTLAFVDTYVVDSWQASDEILLKSTQIWKETFLFETKEDIPKVLAKEFNRNFPKYDWRVLVNPRDFYLVKDVWIKLSTDGFDFYEGDKDIYFVYGIEV